MVVIGFMVPFDVLGWPLVHKKLGKIFTTGLEEGSTVVQYRRGECVVRFFETRCVLEIMRACSVWVTTMSDPHGPHCAEIEAHSIDNVWTTATFARCGDNIYSGHAGQLLSLAVCVQS